MAISMRIGLYLVLFGLFFAEPLAAQLKMPFKRHNKRAATNSLELSAKNGPWLIMCTSFTGEDAEQRAKMLANELRQHRLSPYIFRKTFDYSHSTTGVGWQIPKSVKPIVSPSGELPDVKLNDPQPELVKMKSANEATIHEVAVLVGDFPSDDDNKAQKTLKKIKMMDVRSLSGNHQSNSDARSAGVVKKTNGGPLRTAFLLPNPMLPDEYFRNNQLDEFVIKINRNTQYSLLDCPGVYSVRIASFRGDSTIDPARIQKGNTELSNLRRAGKALTSSQSGKALEDAHKLAEMLRKKGVEAYEFHDRYESFVCIGSFDWVTRKSNGSVLNNPEIVRIVNSCRPESKSLPGMPPSMIPKTLNGILLDPEPTPILVPKVNSSSKTAGRLSFLR